ncbi:MAG: NADH-quinone oxidoreductase subunit C [Geobacter sp.]|nr:NADH-quinone oxidoreductase subunit C [Geobacter sp.]
MIYQKITNNLKDLFDRSHDSHGMLVLELSPEKVLPLVTRLKEEFGFDLFLDVTAVDYPEREPRFDVVYHFYSSNQNKRIRLKVQVPETEPVVPTLTGLYGSARYLERETHEMYGIRFNGNDDLRPILLYEGFVGHPLRKDYPIDMEQPIVEYRKQVESGI